MQKLLKEFLLSNTGLEYWTWWLSSYSRLKTFYVVDHLSWFDQNQLSNFVFFLLRLVDPYSGPLSELSRQRRRLRLLTSITDQLKVRECKSVMAVAIMAKSKLMKKWKHVDLRSVNRSRLILSQLIKAGWSLVNTSRLTSGQLIQAGWPQVS